MQKIQAQVLDIAATAVKLQVSIPGAPRQARSVNWEVCEVGAIDPVRYGLCLLDPVHGASRVWVMGLKPGGAYQFRFTHNESSSPWERFETAAVLDDQRAA